MRVVILESVCAGGPRQHPDWNALWPEAQAMLTSVATDFAAVPGCEVTVIAAPDVPLDLSGVHLIRSAATPQEAVDHELRNGDALLVICPEDDAAALELLEWASRRGVRQLGCEASLVRLCGDKQWLCEWLAAAGIRVPQAITGRRPALPVVLKPRRGCGCQSTRYIAVNQPLPVEALDTEQWRCEPYYSGTAASVILLCGPDGSVPLIPCRQWIERNEEGVFNYAGGDLPLEPALVRRAQQLALRAVSALPHPRGFLGVDLVLGNDAGGNKDYVIEINPRLTTSYIGLRAVAETNLAAALLDVLEGRPVECRFRPAKVRFLPNGLVQSELSTLLSELGVPEEVG